MTKILVAGRSGQLAQCLMEKVSTLPGLEVICLGRPDLDLARPSSVAATVRQLKPDIMVNAAAYTAVDRAEAEPDQAFAINRDGAAALARVAADVGLPLIHISTDYVFSGDKGAPYVETDATGPVNVYGQSKLAGEEEVRAAHSGAIILRTSWVVSPFGGNFLKTMLRLATERSMLSIVDDCSGCPTSALDLADAILGVAPQLSGAGGGTYHFCNAGSTSWFGLARFIFAVSRDVGGPVPELTAISSADYPTAAKRPVDSRLDTAAFTRRFGVAPRPWEDAVGEIVHRVLARRRFQIR